MNALRQLRDTVDTVREVLDRSKAYDHPYMSEEDIADLGTALEAVETVAIELDYTTSVQALALASLVRQRAEESVVMRTRPFDLPDGYWLVTFEPSGFTCGIAPDGSVSS